MAKSKTGVANGLFSNTEKPIQNQYKQEQENQKQPPEDNKKLVKPKEKPERRTQRVSLLLTPTLYKATQEKCNRFDQSISLNEVINQLLEAWVKE